jgi:hypothetical protein
MAAQDEGNKIVNGSAVRYKRVEAFQILASKFIYKSVIFGPLRLLIYG